METTLYSQVLVLEPEDNKRLLNLCGRHDEHIHLIEKRLEVHIKQRGFSFSISGIREAVEKACEALHALYHEAQKQRTLLPNQVHLYLQAAKKSDHVSPNPTDRDKASRGNLMDIRTKRSVITARGENQVHYFKNILNHDINFGSGGR